MTEFSKAIDILDKMDFFHGQRAGRELWNDKPRAVQDKDVADFARDVKFLKDFINRQKAEIERLQSMNQSKLDMIHDLRAEIENTQQSVGNWILKPEKFVDVSYNNDMSINETIVGDCYLICSECGREFFVYEYIGEDSQKSTNFDTLLKEFPYCTCGTKMKEIKYGWKALL